VVTAFTDPVSAVAVVIDDEVGGDAAAEVSINLADAVRPLDPSGTPQPPRVLIDGVRTILIYAVETEGQNPRVSVEGCATGQLAGVLGTSADAVAMAESLARSGIAAAVRQPLVGGPGDRQLGIALGDDTDDDTDDDSADDKRGKKSAKKAVKKTAKKAAKKAVKKGARR
jgi:hypothetical protein